MARRAIALGPVGARTLYHSTYPNHSAYSNASAYSNYGAYSNGSRG